MLPQKLTEEVILQKRQSTKNPSLVDEKEQQKQERVLEFTSSFQAFTEENDLQGRNNKRLHYPKDKRLEP